MDAKSTLGSLTALSQGEPMDSVAARAADRFMCRITPELRDIYQVLAASRQRSSNSEMVCALHASLSGRTNAELINQILVDRLGEDAAAKALLFVDHFAPAKGRGDTKVVIRMPVGMGQLLSDHVEALLRSYAGQKPSMQLVVIDSLVWWVNLNRELDVLFEACTRQGKQV